MSGNRLVLSVLAVWALLASAAAAYFATREVTPAPPPKPSPAPPTAPAPRPHLPAAQGQLDALLKLALGEPAASADPDDQRPMIEKLGSLIRELNEGEKSDGWTWDKENELYRKIFSLITYDTDSHLALMELMEKANTQDEADDILEFLVWSPFGKMRRNEKVTDKITESAKNLLANDPNPARRYGATRVLYRYGRPTREDVLYGLERLKEEMDPEVRDVLLEEICVAGVDKGLTRGQAEPYIDALRSRLGEGELWCANALADWSDSPEDFRWIKRLVEEEKDFNRRQPLMNAFVSGTPFVRGREREVKDVLVSILTDRSTEIHLRRMARDFLQSYGPMDADDAAAVRGFEADWKNR